MNEHMLRATIFFHGALVSLSVGWWIGFELTKLGLLK